jgi:hypothetical protein
LRNLLQLILLGLTVLICGCQGLNSRFGIDGSDYSDAKELSQVKLPAGSLPLSTRYNIPVIADPNGPVIYDVVPPDYEIVKRG